jgi:hypothetical protein
MIMGTAAHLVPTLCWRGRQNFPPLPSLWVPFVLVNAGCFLRVSLQTLTDWHPVFFSLVGVSGILEGTGLGIWGFGLVRILRKGQISDHLLI